MQFSLLAVVCICIICLILVNSKKEKKIVEETPEKTVAFYMENSEGEYVAQSDKFFPTTGYVLNLEKSYCKNGGALSQDSTTKKISMVSSSPEACMLYFSIDNSNRPVIKKVNLSVEDDLVKLDSVILEKEELVKEYYISVDEGEYQRIHLKDFLPFDFCGHMGNSARDGRFSMYVVTVDGVASDVFNFTYGEFECWNNVSISISKSGSISTGNSILYSESISKSESISISKSESISMSESTSLSQSSDDSANPGIGGGGDQPE